jgi:hypothetical protein
MSIQLPSGMTNEMCVYLEKLRQSGDVNMHGATPYLHNEFSLPNARKAMDYCRFWMQNYQQLITDGIISREEA